MDKSLQQYIELYREHGQEIRSHSPELLNGMREAALQRLGGAALPEKGEEKYSAVSVRDMMAPDYGVNINRVEFPVDASVSFRCGVPNITTLMGIVVNDTFHPTNGLLRNLPRGMVMMSLAKAASEMPGLVERYLGKLVPADDAAAQLNTLLMQDGVMVYVPKGMALDRPLQLVNIFSASAPVMGVRRLLIVIDDGASASMLVCDHTSSPGVKFLASQVTEIFVGQGASFEFYEMEESSAHTSRLSQLYARQAADSRLTVNGSSLMGGVTRNEYTVDVEGDGSHTRIGAMAIGADSEVMDTTTEVRHHSRHSTSQQLLKYVLDDHSVGAFYGTIVVDEKAVGTNASQTNRNILASADARMYTRPQLEIYCDDVKCSHGATVGQLDANALFYMRSRGIPLQQARLLLMQAFMQDVIDMVSIPALKTRLQQLIESRLSGNHTLCSSGGDSAACATTLNTPCHGDTN